MCTVRKNGDRLWCLNHASMVYRWCDIRAFNAVTADPQPPREVLRDLASQAAKADRQLRSTAEYIAREQAWIDTFPPGPEKTRMQSRLQTWKRIREELLAEWQEGDPEVRATERNT